MDIEKVMAPERAPEPGGAASVRPGPLDHFWTAAERHREDVRRIREINRRKRLRRLAYFQLVLLAWLVKRAAQGNPVKPGLPNFGPDAIFYLFPLLLVLMLGLAMLLPLANGRSPAVRFSPEQISVRFQDVRGIDGVLEEAARTLQIFLAYRAFREELGGNPRRGILFEGRPGTGKTHLAKAMAAEAGVPFFFVSAPSFQSMWYGMTAWKIRAFFKSLRKAARKEGGAIGFIEEIDAIGASRGGVSASAPVPGVGRSVSQMASSSSGSQGMVNELLIQMQSFDAPTRGERMLGTLIDLANSFLPAERALRKPKVPYHNVLIVAATNLAETLDPALLRPGRFDRILHFDLPSKSGRRDLIDYFLTTRAHAEDMDREDLRDELAAMTLGYSPAMLEHVLDEALVWAVRDGRRSLNWRDVQQARMSEEIGLGQPVAYTRHERRVIATHEAGHAVAAYLCAKNRKLEVLSIIKRRSALGLLAHSDTEERFTRSKSELVGTLRVALAGMAAEEIFFGEPGTGPSSDLAAATSLAAQMVGSFGMGSSLISYDAVGGGPHSPNLVARVLTSERGRDEVDELLQFHKLEVGKLLIRNRHLVEALRDALLEREELLGDEILHVLEESEAGRR